MESESMGFPQPPRTHREEPRPLPLQPARPRAGLRDRSPARARQAARRGRQAGWPCLRARAREGRGGPAGWRAGGWLRSPQRRRRVAGRACAGRGGRGGGYAASVRRAGKVSAPEPTGSAETPRAGCGWLRAPAGPWWLWTGLAAAALRPGAEAGRRSRGADARGAQTRR